MISKPPREMDLERSVPKLFIFSFLLIVWWRAVWSLLDMLFARLARGKNHLLIAFDVGTIIIILAAVFFHPEMREMFAQ